MRRKTVILCFQKFVFRRKARIFAAVMKQNFLSPQPFALECGETLPSIEIAYDTYGTLNAAGDNAVWVCHGLTASSDVADWWPRTVEAGRFLDPERHFVVCANILGSHYGTTGPLSVNPATGRPWYGDFPAVSVRDMVRAHQLLARHLGIRSLRLLVGSSIGGFQALEWLIMEPRFARQAVLIATAARASAWISAFNESQRMAIEADATYGEPSPEAGLRGMAAARSIALLSYRGAMAYELTQTDDGEALFRRRVNSYQRHQGDKIVQRFNAYSYYRLSQSLDSHNVGRGRGGMEQALRRIEMPVLAIGVSSDIIFPPRDVRRMADGIPHSEYVEITSDFGHDGFLVETDKLNSIIMQKIF